jgi:3-oxoacyl-[acyl-carrier-protein] synthase III
MTPPADLVARLLAHLREVHCSFADASTRFADAIDSMGFVEFLTLVADDCGVPVEAIERAAGHRYGTVEELAAVLNAAGLRPGAPVPSETAVIAQVPASRPKAWLAATSAALPSRKHPASEINALLRWPLGWLENHAGIHARCLWGDEGALDAASRTADACLRRAGLSADALGALLVTSEAPPVLAGLAAALHQRLGLPSGVAALEIGGACTGFLAALWTTQRLLVDSAAVLIVAIEAPTRWLTIEPSSAGETAALFGDAVAACVVTAQPANSSAGALRDIALGTDGTGGPLLRVQHEAGRGVTLDMNGVPLAQRAVRTMADAVRRMSASWTEAGPTRRRRGPRRQRPHAGPARSAVDSPRRARLEHDHPDGQSRLGPAARRLGHPWRAATASRDLDRRRRRPALGAALFDANGKNGERGA